MVMLSVTALLRKTLTNRYLTKMMHLSSHHEVHTINKPKSLKTGGFQNGDSNPLGEQKWFQEGCEINILQWKDA